MCELDVHARDALTTAKEPKLTTSILGQIELVSSGLFVRSPTMVSDKKIFYDRGRISRPIGSPERFARSVGLVWKLETQFRLLHRSRDENNSQRAPETFVAGRTEENRLQGMPSIVLGLEESMIGQE